MDARFATVGDYLVARGVTRAIGIGPGNSLVFGSFRPATPYVPGAQPVYIRWGFATTAEIERVDPALGLVEIIGSTVEHRMLDRTEIQGALRGPSNPFGLLNNATYVMSTQDDLDLEFCELYGSAVYDTLHIVNLVDPPPPVAPVEVVPAPVKVVPAAPPSHTVDDLRQALRRVEVILDEAKIPDHGGGAPMGHLRLIRDVVAEAKGAIDEGGD